MNKHFGEFLPFGWMVGIDPTLWSDYLVAYLNTDQTQSPIAAPFRISTASIASQNRNTQATSYTKRPVGESLSGLSQGEIMNQQHNTHAIVIGGSLAGLWTARVLSDHFDQVTVLERDQLPEHAEHRSGTPQDKHIHILLERGSSIMHDLFPGIGDELQAAGAQRVDLALDARMKMRDRWMPRYASERYSYACSRIVLEANVRRRLACLPNVALRGGARVQGLVEQQGKITGVHVRWQGKREMQIESADFVVDASGRGSKTPQWLDALGYEQPTETVIDAQLGYASRRYRPPQDKTFDWHTMAIGQYAPYHTRAGLISTAENGDWMVLLAGIMADYPPTDADAFDAYAKTIDPEFYAALQSAEPIDNVVGYRRTENRWRHYERMARWPDRFVVVGDATCGFNPIYGQGMTVAAMAAEALDKAFKRSKGRIDGVAQRYQKAYHKVVEPAWLLSASSDLEWLGQNAATTPAERFAGWYLPKLLAAMPFDRRVHIAFIGVSNLSEPLTVLFRPGIVARVLRHWWQSRKTDESAETTTDPAAADATATIPAHAQSR
jgi:2-polyprenyl-6-methoxyphenol hydroxylase-like FAD-dependent oxidoreductase